MPPTPGKTVNAHINFMFQGLGARCQEILSRQLTITNALELFHLAMLHRGQDLKEKALQIIKTNFQQIKISRDWIAIEKERKWIPGIIEITVYMSKR